MRIALVTCAQLPDFEVDDRRLVTALEAHGVEVVQPAWDAAVDWSAMDLAVVRTTWDYWHRRAAFVAWAEQTETATRLWPDPAVLAWNTDKHYLRELAAAGIPVAPTLWWTDRAEPLAQAMAREGWEAVMVKPAVGAAASDTAWVRTPEEAAAADAWVAARLGAVGGFLVQPFLSSVLDQGEFSVVVLDGQVTHGVRKIPVAGDYRVQDDHGATDEPWTPDAAALAVAERCLAWVRQRFGRVFTARVDLLWHDGGWVLNELELVEPSLFFRHAPAAAEVLAAAMVREVRG